MAFSYTLTTLTAKIQEWLEDDGAEFVASIPDIINLAEIQLLRDLPFSIFDVEATGSITAATVAKPAGLVSLLDFFITVADEAIELLPKPPSYVRMYGGAGTPLYYAETSDLAWTVAPVPAVGVPYSIRFIKRPPTLAVDSPNGTWLSQNVPDALFWGCIMASQNFRKADDRVEQAKGFYDRAVMGAKTEHRHLIRREYRP